MFCLVKKNTKQLKFRGAHTSTVTKISYHVSKACQPTRSILSFILYYVHRSCLVRSNGVFHVFKYYINRVVLGFWLLFYFAGARFLIIVTWDYFLLLTLSACKLFYLFFFGFRLRVKLCFNIK